MSATVAIYALYGIGTTFALDLMEDGTYGFLLSGNTPPLFPRVELGRWSGEDEATVSSLRSAIQRAAAGAPSNGSPLPDSAFIYVRPTGIADDERDYSLYEPPPAWAPVQQQILDTVHGPWSNARELTVTGGANWLQSTVREGDELRIRVVLTNTSPNPVDISNPHDASRWQVLVRSVPPSGLPLELQADSLQIVPVTGGGTTPRSIIAPAASIELDVVLQRPLSPGTYEAQVAHSMQLALAKAQHNGILRFALAPMRVDPR